MIRLIDLDSIRRNPNAGRDTYLEPGRVTTTERWNLGDRIETRTDGFVSMVVTTKKPKLAEPELLERKQEREVGVIRMMEPEPEFFFEYAPLPVTCRACKATFDFSKLESDCGCGPEDDWQSDTICPECHEMQCLEEDVVEETIDQAMHRLSKINIGRFFNLHNRKAP
jgi:hypothetical protein